MNLDALVSAGSRPWQPSPVARDLDVWDKSDFPTCGTFRLGHDLIIFTLVTAVGSRSLWAYVPVTAHEEATVTAATFDTESAFDDFLAARFAGREAVFAAAENLLISAKSDGVRVPVGKHALLRAGATWYRQRAAAMAGLPLPPPFRTDDSDPGVALREAQSVLADSAA